MAQPDRPPGQREQGSFVGRQDAEPDFVKFVRDIALLATGDEPTFSQIATAFRTHYREKKVPE